MMWSKWTFRILSRFMIMAFVSGYLQNYGLFFQKCSSPFYPFYPYQQPLQCGYRYIQCRICESICKHFGAIAQQPCNFLATNQYVCHCFFMNKYPVNFQNIWWNLGNKPQYVRHNSSLDLSGRRQGTCKSKCEQSTDAAHNACILPNGNIGNCCFKNSVNPSFITTTTQTNTLPWNPLFNTTIQAKITTTRTTQRPLLQKKFWKIRKFYNEDQLKCGREKKKNIRKKRESSSYSVSYIVGGSNVVIGTHPWFVAIGKTENGDINWDCGGSVINDRWVLTSAHCLYGIDKKRTRLFVGGGNLNTSANLKNIRIARFVIHPDYSGSRRDVRNDIALIQTLGPLETTPICLQPHEHHAWPKAGSVALVLGYGYGRSSGQISDTLKEAKVTVLPHSECIGSYGKIIINSTDLICARGELIEDIQTNVHSEAVSDSCQGDSGGPMVRFHRENLKNVYSIVGIIAGGKGCGHRKYPGIYIDLKKHTDWIIDTVVE